MAGHVFPSRDGSNAGDSTTHAIDHSALRRAFNRTAVVIIALIVAVAMALPQSAVADPSTEYVTVTSNEINRASVELTATVWENGQEQQKTLKGDQLNSDIVVVPDRDMEFYIDVHLKDSAVVQSDGTKKLNWEYPIGMAASLVKDQSEIGRTHTVMDGDQKVADVTLVNDGGNLKLQVQYDPTYASDKDTDFFFSYSLKTVWHSETIPSDGKQEWTFPGLTNNVTVQQPPRTIHGGKNCNWVSVDSLEMTCTVELEADGDVENFTFTDTPGSNLQITSDMKVTYKYNAKDEGAAKNAATALTSSFSTENGVYKTEFSKLPKGKYEITYTAKIKDDTQFTEENGDKKYEQGKNTANWKWDNGEDSAEYVPVKKKPNYNWISKNGWVEDSSKWYADGEEQKREIKWTVDINNGGDRANLAGYTLTDTVQDGHVIDPTTVNVRGWGQDNQEIKPIDVEVKLAEGNKGFSIEWPNDTTNYNKYQIEYKTKPTDSDDSPVQKYSNRAEVCKEGDCETATKDVDRPTKPTDPDPDNPDQPTPENPKVDGNLISKIVGTASPVDGTNVYSVPWEITYTPPTSGEVKNLHMYEDWVNAVSDGNTLHMWYSKDYLNLRVDVYNIGNDPSCSEGNSACWTSVPADKLFISAADKKSEPDKSGKGYPDEYWDIRSAYDGSWHQGQGRDLPEGTDYPEGYFRATTAHDGQEQKRNGNDTWSLHDGAPAFTFSYMSKEIKDANNNTIINVDQAFSHKMRIRYNTLCDGTPDHYINYAKFSYTLNGQPADEVKSATIPFVGDELAGKTVDPENVGKDYWTNKATCDDDKDYCVVHWRTWGNSKQSWWSIKEHYDSDGKIEYYEDLKGLSGVNELPESITVTDTLPRGWQLMDDDDHPIYGRFVSIGEYTTGTGKNDGRSDGWLPVDGRLPQIEKTFKISTNAQCDTAKCATYASSGNAFTVTIPNNDSLTSWDTKTVGTQTEGSETGGGPTKHYPPSTPTSKTVGTQGHSIVVVEFDTKISKEELKKQGWLEGSKFTYTNNVDFTFGDRSYGATGDVYVAEGNAPVLGKYVDGDVSDNQLKFVVEIDLQKNDFGENDEITLVDTLRTGSANYVADSFVLATDSGEWDKVTPQPTVETKKGSDNRWSATLKFKPAELKNKEYENKTEKLYKNKKLKLFYKVQVRGIPGQSINVGNTVTFGGNSDASASTSRRVSVTQSTADAGATGSVTLTKISKINDVESALPGAKFKVCEVNLQSPVKTAGASVYNSSGQLWDCQGTVREGTADKDGKIKFANGEGADSSSVLHNFKQNTLYVAWETEAPKGFALNTAPQFFYLKANRAENSVRDQQAMADFADANNLSPWDANFKVEDPQTEFGLLKVDGTVATPGSYTDPNIPDAKPKPTYVVRDTAYLGGSEWTITAMQGKECLEAGEPEKVTPAGSNIACKVKVVDGGAATTISIAEPVKDGEGNETWQQRTIYTQLKDVNSDAGKISVKGLLTGMRYKLKETKAPAGYTGMSGEAYFTINADGTVEWEKKGAPEQLHQVTDNRGNPTGAYAVDNTKAFEWLKVDDSVAKPGHTDDDEKKPTYVVPDNAYLSGTEWTLENMGEDCEKAVEKVEEKNRAAKKAETTPAGSSVACLVKVVDGGSEVTKSIGEGDAAQTIIIQLKDENAADGRIAVKGLTTGVRYVLRETKAKAGYNLLDTPLAFTITKNGVTWEDHDALHKVTNASGKETGEYAIGNTPGVQLPSAGSVGNNWLILSGLAFVVATLMFGMWYVNSESRGSARGRRARV